MPNGRRLAAWCGIVTPIVGLGGALVAVSLSSEFTWAGSALSNLGVESPETAAWFNGGLLLAGIIAIPFVVLLLSVASGLIERLAAITLLGAMIFMGLVGVFPMDHAVHGPIAATYGILFTYAMWLYGTAMVLDGSLTWGVATIWVGIAHVTSWLVWSAGIRIGPGIAVPETIGALLLGGWVVAVAVSMLSGGDSNRRIGVPW